MRSILYDEQCVSTEIRIKILVKKSIRIRVVISLLETENADFESNKKYMERGEKPEGKMHTVSRISRN
jgi:hypothetical protein